MTMMMLSTVTVRRRIRNKGKATKKKSGTTKKTKIVKLSTARGKKGR